MTTSVGNTNIKMEDVDPDNFDTVFKVNVRGIFNGCKGVLPYMREKGYGRIVNIASITGKEGNAGMLAYSASKSAVIGLTKTIGKEYAETGITCNALAPAVLRTQMVCRDRDYLQCISSRCPSNSNGRGDAT
jgi:3-oxoacyl-[acyl-carrier protein] reductase